MKEPAGLKDDDGRAKLYADIAHPINSICREMIQNRVIQAFEEEKARSKLPGYVPSYEDFDGETTVSAATAQRTPAVTTQIQGAEKPHGPHKIPPHKPQPQQVSGGHAHDGHAVNGFGAGIFE